MEFVFLQGCNLNSEMTKSDVSKCGEVFVNQLGEFSFDCFFCGVQYQNEQFFKHILKDHIENNFCVNSHFPKKHKILTNQDVDQDVLDSGISVKTEIEIGEAFQKNITLERNTQKNNEKEERTSKKFQNVRCLKTMERQIKVTCDNERVLGKAEKTKDILQNKKSKFSCDICSLSWNKRKDLLSHKRTKCGFRCDTCSQILQDEKQFRIHSRNHNQNQREKDEIQPIQTTFLCEICGKNSSDLSNLKAHIRMHDPSRKVYSCDKCDQEFFKETSLQNHLKLKHLKEKPFECKVEQCGRSFISAEFLEKHKKFHCGKRHECSICNKKYLYKSKLREHIKLRHVQGKVQRCPECDKTFYEPWTLKSHMICHSGKKPFKCDECDKKFPREKALLWHKKVHSGVKDYICKICNQAFYLYNGLYSHMRSHNIKYSIVKEKDLLLKVQQNNSEFNNNKNAETDYCS